MRKKGILSLVVVLSMLISLAYPLAEAVHAAPGYLIEFDISEGNITFEKFTEDGAIKVTYGGETPQDYEIIESDYLADNPDLEFIISGTSTANGVVVDGVTVNITINNLDIQLASNSPFSLINGAVVDLTLVGVNTFKTTTNMFAGLTVAEGQSIDIMGDGSITATGDMYGAAIGGGYGESGGAITISGGTVTATGGEYGAGIGGGYGESGGAITISGGTVMATGGYYGAGIGGGHSGNGEDITISGGEVTATGGDSGAGIGGGSRGNGGNINIMGGVVTAICNGLYGTGIGGGHSGSGGDITISEGVVTATGGDYGAGIGGGYSGSGGVINISDGVVTATGRGYGAGIGGGFFGSVGVITISGGVVTATCEDSGAGIGNGNASVIVMGDKIDIKSTATIKAASRYNAAISDAINGNAKILMATFESEKNAGINTSVYDIGTSTLINSITPSQRYKSVAFTVPESSTYKLKHEDIIQMHSLTSSEDFEITADGVTAFINVKDSNIQVTPSFSPVSGEVAAGTTVIISSAGADAIYYTTDGLEPTTTSINQETTPLVINEAVTVKAIAVKAGMPNSAIGTASYTVPALPTVDLVDIELSGLPNNYTYNKGTYTYESITVENSVNSITVTPTGVGAITVDGAQVTSGNVSEAIELTPGVEKTITVVATEMGKTAKTYTLYVTRGLEGQATPSFSPVSGEVAAGTTVIISSTGADAIYYTTDGSEPTTASTSQGAIALVINEAVTVKAMAVKTGMPNSAIGTASYTVPALPTAESTSRPKTVKQSPVIVIVNGKEEDAGTETKSVEEGRSVVTVAINSEAIDGKIEDAVKNNAEGSANTIQVPVSDKKSEVAKVELTGDIVKKLEEDTFDISIKRDIIEYIIPAEEFTISKVAENLGVLEKDLHDIKIQVEITNLDETVVAKYNEVAKVNGADLVFPPVEFEIVAKTTKTNGTTDEVEISKFSNYVERIMEIPPGVDQSEITTGIVFNPDGTYSHVPTEIFQKDGKWYAKLNSLTNSNYAVIWNVVTVESVENHWGKDAVNDMASRLVIFNPEEFKPDKAITRGDFAEYIVRALGLYREDAIHENKFEDVSGTGERALAILIASEYGIVTGYPDETFRPDQQITREEAMVMYQRAMKITNLTGYDTLRFDNYTDFLEVSDWARTYVKDVLSAHVFNGTSSTIVSPKSDLTYAQAAQAIKNLLVQSKLINK